MCTEEGKGERKGKERRMEGGERKGKERRMDGGERKGKERRMDGLMCRKEEVKEGTANIRVSVKERVDSENEKIRKTENIYSR